MAHEASPTIEGRHQLVEWLAGGCAPEEAWKIGTEHEKFLFRQRGLKRPAYGEEAGIAALLGHLAEERGWTPIMEGANVIGLKDNDAGSITLEPGGQFELSGAQLENLHQTCDETKRHLDHLQEATGKFDLGMLGVGFDPLWRREDIPWMPKGRYRIMRDYMPKVGGKGLDMMQRTCTIQVNLDYASEADMARKFKVSLALQPLATALFANSPFREGQPTGLLSTRAEAWMDTDPDRCGVPACVFEEGFGFERWVDYILDVPMYFLHRGDSYADVAGLSFRDFMDGKLPGHEGELPTMADWEDHITTAFPEVRLKTFLEMRGADGGPWNMICALPALWVGLLYDMDALAAAEELVNEVAGLSDARAIDDARQSVARDGLGVDVAGRPALELARRMVDIASEGLNRRGRVDSSGNDETGYLGPLRHIAESGETRAETLLRHFRGDWGGSLEPLYREFQF